MYGVLVDDIEHNIDRFQEFHMGDFYGGSDVASICGIGWNSPIEIWLRKTQKIINREETEQMGYGKAIEPYLRTLLAKRIKKDVKPVNQIWQHPERPWQIGSPDVLVEGNELGELKAHKIYAEKYWNETTASDSAICQMQWYLDICGFSGGYCAALIAGDCEKFYNPHFERDDQIINQLLEQVENFRELVRTDTPPCAGPGDAKLIQEHLIRMTDKNLSIDLTESHRTLIDEYQALQEKKKPLDADVKRLKDRMDSIKNQMVLDSQGCGKITVGDSIVSLARVVVQPYMNNGSEYYKMTIKEGKKR